MAASYALNAGDPLDDLVSRVRGGHQPILLGRSGEPVAAVVTIGVGARCARMGEFALKWSSARREGFTVLP
jgi:antitoxin (DNA-binding transcriptional repressor) of toxin-antitoxin stability system